MQKKKKKKKKSSQLANESDHLLDKKAALKSVLILKMYEFLVK